MACFTLGFLQALLVNLVILGAVYAIIKLIVPLATAQFPVVGQVIMIICWAVVVIFVIYLVFGLLSCMMGGSGFHFNMLR